MSKQKPVKDFLELNTKSEMMRVSPEFKKLVDEQRKILVHQGLTPKTASSRLITKQIAKQLKKPKRKTFFI